MPRELMHWEILLRAAERTEEAGATIVSGLLREYRELSLIGAVAHDAPYYFRGGGTPFERVGNGLHGLAEQDTFHPMRLLATRIAADSELERRRACWGFLLGMISHAIADQWVHPWVFFCTGDYYHPDPNRQLEARLRHRLLEVYLESWVTGSADRRAPDRSLVSLVRSQRGAPIDAVCSLLGAVLDRSLFFPQESKRDTSIEWREAIRDQAYLQWIFINPIFGAALDLAARIFGSKVRSIEALSSFGRTGFGSELMGRFEYRNPATGENRSATIRELVDGAADECARLFIALDSEIDSPALPAILRLYRGVSLNYGAWGVGPGEATHYSETGLPLPGLTIAAP